MKIYKNDYTQKEDETLWELHEIRHELHEELKTKSIEEINKKSFDILKEIKKRHSKNLSQSL
ncbi:MAG TPA: hypothetical protein DHW82_07205 [Spirochaetia bacterium]|nr:hypothetical protein [Spirochaetia bacterium]